MGCAASIFGALCILGLDVKCHMFVSNLIIVQNVWTRDTAPFKISTNTSKK